MFDSAGTRDLSFPFDFLALRQQTARQNKSTACCCKLAKEREREGRDGKHETEISTTEKQTLAQNPLCLTILCARLVFVLILSGRNISFFSYQLVELALGCAKTILQQFLLPPLGQPLETQEGQRSANQTSN